MTYAGAQVCPHEIMSCGYISALGHLQTLDSGCGDVRFTPQNGHSAPASCPLSAISGHWLGEFTALGVNFGEER